MSFATLIGVLLGFGLFVGSVMLSTDNYMLFLNGPSIVMVVGGTLASTLISYEVRYVWLAAKGLGNIMVTPKFGRTLLNFEVGRIIRWGYMMQSKGLPALEQETKKAKKGDPFLSFAIELLITAYPGDSMRTILENTVNTTFGRNMVQVMVLKYMAAAAPAFGMIGTLVGLMVMLDSMGGDPSSLGAGLAVALCTTLYGVLVARLVLLPAANKLQQRQEILRFRNQLLVEGFIMLADKKSPRNIQDTMNSFLDPSIHFDIDKQMKRGK